MMELIPILSVTILGQPVGKGRPRMSPRGHAYTPGKTREWEAGAAGAMALAWPFVPLEEPVAVTVRAVSSRPRKLMRRIDPPGRMWRTAKPDADNVLKIVCDALEKAGVVADDRYIVMMSVQSLYVAKGETARVEVELSRSAEEIL